MEKQKFSMKVELVKGNTLKDDILKANDLSGDELVVKKVTKNSPIEVSYEKIEGGLANFLTHKISGSNMKPLVNFCRERFA